MWWTKTFDAVNDCIFNAQLDYPADIIEVNTSSSVVRATLGFDYMIDGVTMYHDGKWYIGIDKNLTMEEKIYTLVHEIVHLWQGQIGLKLSHGKTFVRKCDEIAEAFSIY